MTRCVATRRGLLAVLLALVGATPAAGAQPGGPDTTVTVDVLRVPDAPGLVLLGGAPSAVERPGTVQALAVSVVTRATEGDLLDGFAVQVAPFWLGGIPGVSYKDYEEGARWGEAVRRTLSFSVATDRLDVGLAEPVPAVAVGARFSLATGRIDSTFQNYAARRRAAVDTLRALNTAFRVRLTEAQDADPEYRQLVAERRAIAARGGGGEALAEIARQLERRTRALTSELRLTREMRLADAADVIGALPERRVGFTADVAGGAALLFPNADVDEAEVRTWGAWTTAGWATPDGAALAVVRFLRERDPGAPDAFGSSLDVGGRLVWDAPGGRLSLSGEGVYRLGLGNAFDDRYRVAAEATVGVAPGRNLAFTFGRDFGGEASGNLLALLRLAATFGGGLRAPTPGA